MYGIVEISGHQYRVEAGMTIDVEKLQQEAGTTIELDKVLFVGGEKFTVGTPLVSGAKVVAEVVRHDKSRKIIVFKRKPGRYKRKNGHRQEFTTLKIKEIKA